MCRFYVTPEYNGKLEELFDELNIFEVDNFKQSHEIIVVANEDDWPAEDEIGDRDIAAYDDISYGAFVDHLDRYFSV